MRRLVFAMSVGLLAVYLLPVATARTPGAVRMLRSKGGTNGNNTIAFTSDEVEALGTAVGRYVDTLERCHGHAGGDHGDRSECDGWSPKEEAYLLVAYNKLLRMK